jgi:hypothetical protein
VLTPEDQPLSAPKLNRGRPFDWLYETDGDHRKTGIGPVGYEDLNDRDSLRKDLLWQSTAERSEELAGCSTLCRLENRWAQGGLADALSAFRAVRSELPVGSRRVNFGF